MKSLIKKNGVLFFAFAALCVLLLSLCACGGSQIPKNVSDLKVFYDNILVDNDRTIEVVLKSDGQVEITVDGTALTDPGSDIDWQKLSACYELENKDGTFDVDNINKYIKVFKYNGEQKTAIKNLPTISSASGKYSVELSFCQTIEFFVTITKESNFQNMNLSFDEQNQTSENTYSYEVETLTSSSYRVMHQEDQITSFGFANITTSEYKLNMGLEEDAEIDLNDIDKTVLSQAPQTPHFENLGIGEWLVAVYHAQEGFEKVYSNVCLLTIFPHTVQVEALPQKVTYTFPVYTTYNSEDQTIEQAFDVDFYDFSVDIGGQTVYVSGDTTLSNIAGNWKLADPSVLTNFEATDGNTIDEENILPLQSTLEVGNSNYVVLMFDFFNNNYYDVYFLVNFEVLKGEVVLPDIAIIGTNTDTEDNFTYTENTTLNLSYDQTTAFYATYFELEESINGLDGITTLTLKNSDKYKFVISQTLTDKLTNFPQNYLAVDIDNENGICEIEWAMNEQE